MENLKGKTAFITGGASGIGLGIAKASAKEGMNVVIADMRQSAIDEAVALFKENGWPVLGLELNVSDRAAYVKAADAAEAAFGNIHLLVNNAGIGCAGGPLWAVEDKDTDIAISVNLIGVLNGIKTIVPRIIAHGEGGHIVSTASKAALIPVPGCGLYNVTKSAVLGVMLTLAMDLVGTNVGASAFCPGGYITNLGASSGFVTAAMSGEAPPPPPPAPPADAAAPAFAMDWDGLLRSPDDAGERVLRGVKRGDLYILTHAEFKEGYEEHAQAVLRAFPEEVANPRYGATFTNLTRNDIFNEQKQVPALGK
ncbi:MAG: SDR family NAD(P)-dependent oxidoreductase [Oscillospiraceae bacterium]|jgi:NAD(P)-dependent dehydrogenase (short-subunit alcohol dehydrogenase family)|nr:SDR family NAD(P)-dependent oxidoreductase [Oscillospiraceae bacterium]